MVEDNSYYAQVTQHHLALNPDNQVEVFSRGRDCLKHLYQQPQLIFLDYSLPDIGGREVLQRILKSQPELPVVIVSGQEDVATAIELLNDGAYDYIVKDNNAKERMWNVVNNIRKSSLLQLELDQLREEVSHKYNFSNIKGQSPAIKAVFKLMEKAVRTSINVSITGETGTGKELVAKAIHYNSSRGQQPLVTVNMAAIPRELMESELFGHEKGAFTGAHSRRIGKFEEADGGSIFLDEIGELDLSLQAKLLRVLQEKEVIRLGGNTTIPVAPRVLLATHKDLAEEVKAGRFREDLYYRLLGLPIEMPPLRQRGSDVLLLAQHFLEAFIQENKIDSMQLSKAALEKLRQYSWPGNVRELKALVELGAVMAQDAIIRPEDITFNSTQERMEHIFQEGLTLRDYTRKIIQHHLEENKGNVLQVAHQLDVGKSTIYRMLKNKELEI